MKARTGNNQLVPVGALSCHSNMREAGGGRKKQGDIQDCIAHVMRSCSSYTPQNVGSSQKSKTAVEIRPGNMQTDEKNIYPLNIKWTLHCLDLCKAYAPGSISRHFYPPKTKHRLKKQGIKQYAKVSSSAWIPALHQDCLFLPSHTGLLEMLSGELRAPENPGWGKAAYE